jgi:hypothetical protein
VVEAAGDTGPRRSARPLAARLVGLALLATLALAVLDVRAPDRLPTTLFAYLLFLAALSTWLLVRVVALAHPGASDAAFRAALRRAPTRSLRPEVLQHLERQLTAAEISSVDLHYHLRPLLRDLAAQRLVSRRNISLDAQPTQAQAILGAAAWALVRPDRPPPADRHARGLDRATLAAIVTTLEEM